ncbi:MAG: glycosyltransferase family 4 protein [Fidelibacterota bacterium]
MRVTLASYHTVTLRHGGPETQIHQTKKYLEEEGIEVALMDMWQNEEILKCDLFHLFASNLGVYDLARYLGPRGIKFVVSPIFFTRRPAWAIRLVCASEKLVRRFASGLWADYGFARDICQWADRCLPNSSDEQALLVRGLGVARDKVVVVPNGVEDRFLDADPEPFYKEYGMKGFILNVGHMGVERKNTLSLIRALSAIDHPAVIIGRVYPSGEADLCLKEARRNKNLLIIQGLNHDSPMLASAYAACDVFALPAKFETPGIAALEAALTGARIVITPYGGTKDYFGDMATYVNPYSIGSIRKGIEYALNQDGDERLKSHVQSNFLWQIVAKKTARVYRDVLGESTAT